MNFKTWQDVKKVKEHDLIFTKALKRPQHVELFTKLSEEMALLEPSFSEGLAFLELGTELILMGHLEALFEKTKSFAEWNDSLKKMRYPQAFAQENKIKATFEKLPWPYGSKYKFERRGDKFGVELKLFISNPSDLTKIIASLERVQQEMNL